MTNTKFISVKEAAEALRVSERSVFRYIHDGKLQAFKVGYWRISEDDFMQFLNQTSSVKLIHSQKNRKK